MSPASTGLGQMMRVVISVLKAAKMLESDATGYPYSEQKGMGSNEK